jgi:DnaJ domain
MPPFITALIIVVGGYWLIRNGAKLKSAEMRPMLQKAAGGGLMAFAALLILRGQFEVAIGLFVLGMGLFGKAHLLPNGFGAKPNTQNQQQEAPPPQRGKVNLPKDEALAILGLKPGATAEDVKQAHKRLMKDFHPDKGGTDYLASKINEAKDVLLS